MEEVKLLGFWVSPFSKRVEIALKLKGIQYEYIAQKMPINKCPEIVKYNPIHKRVPVLLHKGKSIAESLLILEYIDATWKNGIPLLPNDPYKKAMTHFWAKFMDEKCYPQMLKICYGSKYEVKVKAIEELHDLLKLLENELIKDNNNLFGGETTKIGYMEIVFISIFYWFGVIQEVLKVNTLNKEEFPNICGWYDKLMSCSFIKENLPPREKLVIFYKIYTKPFIRGVSNI